MVDFSSPRDGEKANHYSAECLKTGEVEWMELEGNGNRERSLAFLERLLERHGGRLKSDLGQRAGALGSRDAVILETPGLNLQLANLPG